MLLEVENLVARYGPGEVRRLMIAMMDYSERLTRHCLSELPERLVPHSLRSHAMRR